MDFDGLDRQLRDSLADLKLSNEERDELRQLGSELAPDQVRFLRNRAFDLVRELVLLEEQGERIAALKWLEQVVRTLEVTAAPPRSRASAYFSPGEECRRKIRELCRQARPEPGHLRVHHLRRPAQCGNPGLPSARRSGADHQRR